MARIEKTAFISYRRTDVYTALAVYENLKNQGYDVFFDYRSISSGDFEQIITANIKARAHFLIILTPTALDRLNEPGDWLRREIETAIDEKRNIIPLFFKGFRFGTSSVSEKLTGKLKSLSHYNGLNVHEDYFDEAMQRVREQFLSKPLNTVLHPISTEVQRVVKEEQVAADEALKHKEEIKEQAKPIEEKPVKKKELPRKPTIKQPVKSKDGVLEKPFPYRSIAGFGIGLAFLSLLIWGGISAWNNLFSHTSEPTHAPKVIPTKTSTPTPEFGIGSTMIGKDGMVLLYIPAGEFTMGSEDGDADEKPVHTIYLDAFWIDQTEVTNAMYAMCVKAGVCKEPSQKSSFTRSNYYEKSEFDNYPVIYVSWNDANTYCSWMDRHLPTEAEWEKAARGTDARVYPWGDNFDGSLVNFCDTNCSLPLKNDSFDDGFADTSPVGYYPNGVSPYGALDMAGNVWEWVEDWYDAYPGNTVSDSVYGTTYRVLRGGAWFDIDSSVRSASRSRTDPTYAIYDVGFRCSSSQ